MFTTAEYVCTVSRYRPGFARAASRINTCMGYIYLAGSNVEDYFGMRLTASYWSGINRCFYSAP